MLSLTRNYKILNDIKMTPTNVIKRYGKSTHRNLRKHALAIFDEQNQFVASETEQLQIITEYFTKLFSSTDVPKPVPPVKMDPPYTAAEIFKASS